MHTRLLQAVVENEVVEAVEITRTKTFLTSCAPRLCIMSFPTSPLQAQKVSDELLQKISSQNRRALDLVAAKCYYYHSRVYEFLNQLDVVRR